MKKRILILAITILLISCNQEEPIDWEEPVDQEALSKQEEPSDQVSGIDNDLFTKSVDVFGVTIVATEKTPDDKVMYAAHIMAQYLDNDEDGAVDNPAVVANLLERNATLFMFANNREAEEFDYDTIPDHIEAGQDLYASETIPSFNPNQENELFDAALEEVLHLITHGGYAFAYPDILGETPGTEIADAMDAARSGHFEDVPDSYPQDAWYTYDDETCEYNCQISEYLYWALTSLLGAQDYPGRAEEIEDEWQLNTPASVRQQDPAIYAILTDPAIPFPTTLPDGTYSGHDLVLEN